MTFKREKRYHVLKASDVEAVFTNEEKALLEKFFVKAARHREEQNKKPLTCVVIESDWPEYEPAWKAIESRVNGKRKESSNLTMQSELEQFKKTGNSTHARWVANELLKAQADSKFENIEKQLDVTVGRTSGGDIKSGLLWAVLDLVEAKNRMLIKNYIEIISHATGGKMNKAYTDISQIKAVIDDSVNEIVEAEKAEVMTAYDKYGLDYNDLEKLLDAMLFLGISPRYESKEEAMHNQRQLILITLRGVKRLGPIMDAANAEYAKHKKQNEIMREALQKVINIGDRYPEASAIAKNGLNNA